LVVGILGGSAGTTRDAFQLLHDSQKYGAKVALFGRKINSAENQLAFVSFLRLIVEGRIGPVDAVKAYHAVLAKLGLRPERSLDDDLQLTDQSMSYSGAARPRSAIAQRHAAAAQAPGEPAPALASTQSTHECRCQTSSAAVNAAAPVCTCRRPIVTESASVVSRYNAASPHDQPVPDNGRPDFARMSPTDRLAYHRRRLGLGR
jgi:hypothetical protein